MSKQAKRYRLATLPGRVTRDSVEVVEAYDYDALAAQLAKAKREYREDRQHWMAQLAEAQSNYERQLACNKVIRLERDALRSAIEKHNAKCQRMADDGWRFAEDCILPLPAAAQGSAEPTLEEIAATERMPHDRRCKCGACPDDAWDYEVTCARCGKVGMASEFEPEEGDEWECRPCNARENARERDLSERSAGAEPTFEECGVATPEQTAEIDAAIRSIRSAGAEPTSNGAACPQKVDAGKTWTGAGADDLVRCGYCDEPWPDYWMGDKHHCQSSAGAEPYQQALRDDPVLGSVVQRGADPSVAYTCDCGYMAMPPVCTKCGKPIVRVGIQQKTALPEGGK